MELENVYGDQKEEVDSLENETKKLVDFFTLLIKIDQKQKKKEKQNDWHS